MFRTFARATAISEASGCCARTLPHQRAWTMLLALVLAAFCAEAAPPAAAREQDRRLEFANEPWSGDFDAMLERRAIRVLVPYSGTFYYNDKGRERGIAAELVRDFEQYLNRKYARQLGKRPVTVYMFPVTRDVLIADVARGLGDIAAGNLTETPARLKIVDFVAPRDRKPVSEVVVTGPASPPITSIDDLAGNRVQVRRASSYYESLTALNSRFKKERRARIQLTLVPDALEDEDLLEMLNAGILDLIVVDDGKARAWAKVLPKINVTDVAVAQGGHTGWAIRKRSPKLADAISDFYLSWAKKRGVIEARIAQQRRRIKQISNNVTAAPWQRFEGMLALFKKYGGEYHFDPLMLAAQGYQESRLEQKARGPTGAIGVMQLMPATAAAMKVGDIRMLEPNIHAGAKYMDRLMTRYFPKADLSEQDRTLFALASYNAGPARIARLRQEAQRRGLDPNLWFDNVELVVAQRVGIETTTYVRNIFKYYTAYKLQIEVFEEQRKARQRMAPRGR